MEKVKVNKEVFEAFESLKKYFLDGNIKNQTVVNNKINKFYGGKLEFLNDMDFDLFLDIIINGYELDRTEEEKKEELLLIYKNNLMHGHDENLLFAGGIKKALDTLEIKVEGINV